MVKTKKHLMFWVFDAVAGQACSKHDQQPKIRLIASESETQLLHISA